MAKGRFEEADVVLAALEGVDVTDPYVITQSKEIQWAVSYERRNTVPWSTLLRGKTEPNGGTCTIHRLLLGMGTQAMQQFVSPDHNRSPFLSPIFGFIDVPHSNDLMVPSDKVHSLEDFILPSY
jgi:hypothetical protein